MEFRRYEARLGVWKVVLGTVVVGLAGVLIPGAISFYSAYFDNQRKEVELRLAKETAYQAYIKEFFTTAINQDIELRIRFASYFANVSEADQRELWGKYLGALITQRSENRGSINGFERQLVDLKRAGADVSNAGLFDEVLRKLQWAYAEVGYVPINRSVVKPPATRKQRLYGETVAVARGLATQQGSLDSSSPDYLRFWQLYEKELIGVESLRFELKMVQIGFMLKALAADLAPPTDALRTQVEELSLLAAEELSQDAQSEPQSSPQSVSQSALQSAPVQ